MNFIIRYALLMVVFFSMNINAESSNKIQLPERLPELSITSESTLGTNEPGIGLAVNSKINDFTVRTINDQPVKLTTLLKDNGNLLVVFYRGGWCPYCNVQVRQLSVAYKEFSQRQVTPVLISADKPDAASLIDNKYDIPFPVLSDPDLKAHKAFNVVFRLPDELVPVYKEYGIELADWSGKDHQAFAVASAFLVDQSGVVLWSHSSTDYKTRPSVKQLLKIIDDIGVASNQ